MNKKASRGGEGLEWLAGARQHNRTLWAMGRCWTSTGTKAVLRACVLGHAEENHFQESP